MQLVKAGERETKHIKSRQGAEKGELCKAVRSLCAVSDVSQRDAGTRKFLNSVFEHQRRAQRANSLAVTQTTRPGSSDSASRKTGAR